MTISSREWEVINKIVKKIYQSADTTEARQAILDNIGELIPYDNGSFMLASLKDGIIDYFDPVTKGPDIKDMHEYMETYQHLDPMCSFYTQTDLTVYIDSEYVTPAMAKSSVVYQEWFWPSGMYYMLGAKLDHNGIMLGSMLLGRKEDKEDFVPHDKEIIEVLAEHLSYRLYMFYPKGVDRQTLEMGGDFLLVKYGLSLREAEVAERLRKGYTVKELADELCISENTVKRHAGSIYKKMGVSGKSQLIVLMSQDNDIK